MNANEQIAALQMQEYHGESEGHQYVIHYYDIGTLPAELVEQYHKDHFLAQKPVIPGIADAVYPQDFEPWRDSMTRRLK